MKCIRGAVSYSAKAILLSTVLVVFGCATGGSKLKLVTDAEHRPDMVPTLQYVPVQEPNPEGGFLPYEAKENPYLAQRSRVEKESVVNFIEARRAYKAGQYAQAQKRLLALTTQDAGLSGPWVMLGDIAVDTAEYQQAVDYYVKAIEINKVNINAYLRLARAQRLLGYFLHAQNTYAKVLSIWPDFPEAHLNLAVLYDIYLNHPLRAQKHMEAYQFLTDGTNDEVAGWLSEIQQRTGIAPGFHNSKIESNPVSVSQ